MFTKAHVSIFFACELAIADGSVIHMAMSYFCAAEAGICEGDAMSTNMSDLLYGAIMLLSCGKRL